MTVWFYSVFIFGTFELLEELECWWFDLFYILIVRGIIKGKSSPVEKIFSCFLRIYTEGTTAGSVSIKQNIKW